MAENDNTSEPSPLSKGEQAYFDTRGEQPIPAETPPAPPPDEPAQAEAVPPQPAPDAPSEGGEITEDQRRQVDHGALLEERKRRQAAEERVRQTELINARMEERFRIWSEAARPPPQPPPKPPSPDEDIFGAVKHLTEQQQADRRRLAQLDQQANYNAQMGQLTRWASEAEAVYRKAQPDYDAALGYLRQGRKAELELWGMHPEAARQKLEQEERDLLQRAAQERKNPAEMAYSLAKYRGWDPSKAARRAPPADPGKQMDMIERGQQQAGRSLSGMGGGGGGNGVDVSALDVLKMPEAQFAKWTEKNPDKWRRMKGG